MSDQGLCANCKWWLEFSKSDKDKDGGMCRRYAPKGMMVIEAGWKTSDPDWPWTYEDDWCGEFQHRDDRAARLLKTRYMTKGEAA